MSTVRSDDEHPDDDHARWSELAAGHVLSALDDADEAAYRGHVVSCERCQGLERELASTLADLAELPDQLEPPASLKTAIMREVLADRPRDTPVAVLADRKQLPTARANRRMRIVLGAAAAVVVAAAVAVGIDVSGGRSAPSIAEKCASVHCPTVSLLAGGRQVATVLVLDKTAYVEASGLPATPSGKTYVLWRISNGAAPVAVAAVHTTPSAGPVAAGPVTVPLADVAGFALSEESGSSAPSAPTDVIAQGNTV